ncbi:hypothetical protein BDN72DRAFT_858945 [Pluteus cervinus]|uniref:Uncharacterized protein n=1 Tax=Pluteus cervinus TaxID=181527 RepID=A0ACD3APH4_9AGAR|nr:hypothetical protein BDN72DRAFT_858945 [Pluteus cervinus]
MTTSQSPLERAGTLGMLSSNLAVVQVQSTPVFLHSIFAQGAIGLLPPELLEHAFLFAIDDLPHQQRAKSVLRLCHVSKHWRSVATGYYLLWTSIPSNVVTRLGLVGMFLEYSKGIRLNLTLSSQALLDRRTMLLVMMILPCVQALSIDPGFNDFRQVLLFECWAPGCASFLRSLKIHSAVIPHDFFSGTKFPVLERLRVDSCTFNPRALPWKLLVVLKLRCCNIAVQDLLDELRNAPQLEKLKLFSSFNVSRTQAVTTRVSSPVQLNALSFLSVEAMSCRSTFTFLNQVSVPSTAYIRAQPNEGGHTYCELVIFAAFRCRRSGPSAIQSLDVGVNFGEVSYNVLSMPITTSNRFDTSTDISFLRYDSRVIEPIGLVWRILRMHNLNDLTTLDLSHSPPHDSESDVDGIYVDTFKFWRLTSRLASIRTIKARDVFARSFVKYMGVSMDKLKDLHSRFTLVEKWLDKNVQAKVARVLLDQLSSIFFGLKKLRLDFRPPWLESDSKDRGSVPLYEGGESNDFKYFCEGLNFRKGCQIGLEVLELAGIDEGILGEELCSLNRAVDQVSSASGAYGISVTALGLAYFATSYMPIEQNQFLYASVPVRLILASLAAGKALTMNTKTVEARRDQRDLWFITVLDGIGGIVLGWWLGEFSGRVSGSPY